MTVFAQFSEIQDPRIDRTKHYELASLFFLTISAAVADCEDFTEIADFGEDRLEWFQSHGHFLDGRTPSHDVIGKLFHRLDPVEFQTCFLRWTADMAERTEGRLEPVQDLLRRSTKKAKTMNCRLVLSLRSQFFHSLRHFSSQAKDRSTTQRLGMTAKACNSLRLATSTSASIRSLTASAKGVPLYPPSTRTFPARRKSFLARDNAFSAPARSVTLAVVTHKACGSPCVSTTMWRLIPETFFPAS